MSLHNEVEEQLRAHGVRPTAQRIDIGMLMLARPCHLSADQLIAQLRETGSRISKATVYNTLNLFAKHGLLRQVAADPSRLFYDSTISPHHHFYNEDTGELVDIDAEHLQIEVFPEPPNGTDTEAVELVIRVRNRRD